MSEQIYTLLPDILLRTVLKPVILPSLAGALFVAAGDAHTANIIWSAANPLLVWHNYKTEDYSQAFLFFIFWLVALSGIFLQGVQA